MSNCTECKFCKINEKPNTMDVCFRFPPHVHDRFGYAAFPRVNKDMMCGEFSEREVN